QPRLAEPPNTEANPLVGGASTSPPWRSRTCWSRVGNLDLLWSSSPSISGRLHVIRPEVRPRDDEGNEDDPRQAGLERLNGVRVQLAGAPEREADRGHPDRLPEKF